MYDDCQSQPYLRLQNLIVERRGRLLIDIPDLSLSDTGITVVMGSNGAGKSLLLRVIHGLDEPTSGQVILNTKRHSQSLVLQTPVLLRRSTEANVRFVLKTRKLPVGNVSDLLAAVRLSGKARVPARRLSGGERQRLAIAQALATEPEVLLLDEPTASLDPSATLMIEEVLQSIAARGVRIVLVTHDAMQARRLAQDVVFLSEGHVCQHSLAEEFFSDPTAPQARAYLAGHLLP